MHGYLKIGRTRQIKSKLTKTWPEPDFCSRNPNMALKQHRPWESFGPTSGVSFGIPFNNFSFQPFLDLKFQKHFSWILKILSSLWPLLIHSISSSHCQGVCTVKMCQDELKKCFLQWCLKPWSASLNPYQGYRIHNKDSHTNRISNIKELIQWDKLHKLYQVWIVGWSDFDLTLPFFLENCVLMLAASLTRRLPLVVCLSFASDSRI